MSAITELIVLTTLAGAAIPAGALLAYFYNKHVSGFLAEGTKTSFRHCIVAFGGGALLSAVALVLIPEGIKSLSVPEAAAAFVAGGLFFWALQVYLNSQRGSSGQFVAMLADFVPEVIALGATMAVSPEGALLLAVLIALQNGPEGFNSFLEFLAAGKQERPLLITFCLVAAAGPALGVLGYWLLADQTHFLALMQIFAAAGILYLVFEDVAPQAKSAASSFPALGAVFGFMLGMLGKILEG